MKNIQPYKPETDDYQFPTSLPKRYGLSPFQKQQVEIEFENHPAFQLRRIVTIVTVSLVVAFVVADILRDGFNRNAAIATACGVTAACLVRRFVASQNGTSQNFYKP
jgi:hypothetical protein